MSKKLFSAGPVYLVIAFLFFYRIVDAQAYFIEKNSRVIVEMESAFNLSGWAQGDTIVSGQVIKYLNWNGTDFFKTPGNQLLEYKIRINTPGTYRFTWHCKVGEGESNTEHNDSWLRIPDASDFYGEKDGHTVHPKGICSSDCPNGAGSGGWFKIYSSGTTDWTWSARTSDNDAHLIYARFDRPGIFTVQVSARSDHHFLDRFVLYRETVYSEDQITDLSLCESKSKKIPKEKKILSIYTDSEDPGVLFAMEELKSALSQQGFSFKLNGTVKSDIVLFPVSSANVLSRMNASLENNGFMPKPEGFSIRRDAGNKIWVAGGDIAGLMYGILELSEQISLSGMEGIQAADQNPYMAKRGIKFNIPLDVRTPSYTDMSDAGQQNIAEMWNLDFWEELIDNLARNRYNLISVWSLHPFPSLIKVPEYPEIALNDVKRSVTKFDEYYSTRATGYDAPEIVQNTETLLEISIDEKIAFWRKVMSYAKARNIDFYIITWNIYTYGIDGKYGITDDMDNETTKDYYRKCVKQLFLTYPDLAGIGVTTGENMGKGKEGFEAKEDWIFDTYGQGLIDVSKIQPDRKITFVHRQHEAGTEYIAKKFGRLSENGNIDFVYSFKYAQAHVLSSTKQSFHRKFVGELDGNRTLWTLRNDDNYYFRWGAPDFVREFIKNIPYEVSKGYYYGSDQYVWGREFLSLDPEIPRQLEIVKHWYSWMLWGRLGYDPEISNERFTGIIQDRFEETDAGVLFGAWQEASMIYPVTTGFHWGDVDYKWYIEGCRSRPEPAQTESGFHDVNRFITLPPHKETGYQSIPDYVNSCREKKPSGLISPIMVSDILHGHADSALVLVKAIDTNGNKELMLTINDIQSMAYLGKYYAHKICGATHLALYREVKEKSNHDKAIIELTAALEYWKLYTASAMQQYKNPLWTNRVGYVDWVKLTEEVKNDIEIAGRD